MFDLNRILRGLAGFPTQILDSILPFSAPALIGGAATLTDGASVAVNAQAAQTFTLTCTDDAVREVAVPSNGKAGQRLFVLIVNDSGGALSQTTFAAAIAQPAITLPADGFNRQYELFYNGTAWSLMSESATDVPN